MQSCGPNGLEGQKRHCIRGIRKSKEAFHARQKLKRYFMRGRGGQKRNERGTTQRELYIVSGLSIDTAASCTGGLDDHPRVGRGQKGEARPIGGWKRGEGGGGCEVRMGGNSCIIPQMPPPPPLPPNASPPPKISLPTPDASHPTFPSHTPSGLSAT